MLKRILIIVPCFLLLLSSISLNVYLYKNYKTKYCDVYVASHQISQRSKISIEDLELIKVPEEYLKDVYIDKEDIIDSYVRLGYSIPKGSLIYESFIQKDIKDLANTLLKENEVNYDIYVNDVKINTANLSPNMYIDLYLTINNNNILVSDLLLSNVRITGLYDMNNKVIKDYDSESKVYIISLAINKDYVAYLNKARVLGEISSVVSHDTYKQYNNCKLNMDSVLIEYLQ